MHATHCTHFFGQCMVDLNNYVADNWFEFIAAKYSFEIATIITDGLALDNLRPSIGAEIVSKRVTCDFRFLVITNMISAKIFPRRPSVMCLRNVFNRIYGDCRKFLSASSFFLNHHEGG